MCCYLIDKRAETIKVAISNNKQTVKIELLKKHFEACEVWDIKMV